MDSSPEERGREYPDRERRTHRRYPVDPQLEYQVVRGRDVIETGFGRVLNLSSDGILFESDHPPAAGATVKLIIAWPSLANRLKVHADGYVVRAHGNCSGVRILHYVFGWSHMPGLGNVTQTVPGS